MEEQKENQTTSLQEHQKTLHEKMRKTNKKHKPFLLLWHLAKALINFARRGIKPFADGTILGVISIIVRLVLILILLSIKQEILFVVIAYAVIHLISFVVGKLLNKCAEDMLAKLAEEAHGIFVAYLVNRNEHYGIDGDTVFYDDGAIVDSNEIRMGMQKKCCDISIYRKDISEESSIYYHRTYNSDDSGTSLNEKIASTQLNNKFGIIAERGNELDAMIFLSPTVQLNMINTPEMLTFSQMRITDGVFTAIIGEPIPFPAPIDIYKWKPLTKHLQEIDKYCAKVRKQADTAHNNLQKISFLLGI